jgi:uncharacterized membrane protein
MISRLRYAWREARSSFWFVPATIVAGAIGLAASLIAVDSTVDLHAVDRWPLLFGAGADGSRGLLNAVAGSMITVAGVVFSITIVALSLASSQYTSRVLRNFMRNRLNQSVLGVFVGVFAYCLVVLRTIRGGEEEPFVPSIAVLGGLLLAFVGIGFLIVFIHHVAASIQASAIVSGAARETIKAVDRLFPHPLGGSALEYDRNGVGLPGDPRWVAVGARKTGYVSRADTDALLSWARECGAAVRMERAVGEFVVEGTRLLSVAGATLDEDAETALNGAFLIGHQRSVEQDVAFGIRQIVDIALRALSPGMNDSTTAVTCIDYLSAILTRLAARRVGPIHRFDQGRLLVVGRGPSFESLLGEACEEIRQSAAGNVAVLTRELRALETIAGNTADPGRRRALRRQVESIVGMAARTVTLQLDLDALEAIGERLLRLLEQPLGTLESPGSTAEAPRA